MLVAALSRRAKQLKPLWKMSMSTGLLRRPSSSDEELELETSAAREVLRGACIAFRGSKVAERPAPAQAIHANGSLGLARAKSFFNATRRSRWVKIDRDGCVSSLYQDRRSVAGMLGLHHRDLRVVDPIGVSGHSYSGGILVRDGAIIFAVRGQRHLFSRAPWLGGPTPSPDWMQVEEVRLVITAEFALAPLRNLQETPAEKQLVQGLVAHLRRLDEDPASYSFGALPSRPAPALGRLARKFSEPFAAPPRGPQRRLQGKPGDEGPAAARHVGFVDSPPLADEDALPQLQGPGGPRGGAGRPGASVEVELQELAEGAVGIDARHLPFELRVLEYCLDRCITPLCETVLALEAVAIPALDALADHADSRNLERVRSIKTRHSRLGTRVQTIREEIEGFLDDDEDLLRINLSFRAAVAGERKRLDSLHEARAPTRAHVALEPPSARPLSAGECARVGDGVRGWERAARRPPRAVRQSGAAQPNAGRGCRCPPPAAAGAQAAACRAAAGRAAGAGGVPGGGPPRGVLPGGRQRL